MTASFIQLLAFTSDARTKERTSVSSALFSEYDFSDEVRAEAEQITSNTTLKAEGIALAEERRSDWLAIRHFELSKLRT